MKGVTGYSGPAGFYFRTLMRRVISTGGLDRTAEKILDFGCGIGELKRNLPGSDITGFDLIPALSDVSDWRAVPFDVLVANQVFCTFNTRDLETLLEELKQKMPRPRLVVGTSRQGFLNNIGKYLLGRPDAHASTQLSPQQELQILEKYCTIVDHSSVMALADVYSLQFRPD